MQRVRGRIISGGRLLFSLVAAGFLAAAAPPDAAVQEKERGDRLVANGDPVGALEAYKNAVRLAPTYAPALNEYGFLLFKQGKKDEAIALFQRATAADPGFPQAYFNLGFSLRKEQRFKEAADAYRRYTELKPDDADGFYGLGEACRNSGDKGCALGAYKAYLARETRPTEQKWIDKARSYADQLEKEGATPVAPPTPRPAPQPQTQPVVQPAPRPAPQPQPVAVAQPQPQPVAVAPQPQPQPATASGTTIPKPEIAKQKLAAGNELMKARNYRDAAIAFQDAVNADPGNVEALFQLGIAYAQLGYYQQAIDRWQRVSQISPDPKWRQAAQKNIQLAQAKVTPAQPKPQPQPVAQAAPPAPRDPAQLQTLARQKYEQGVKFIYERRYAEAIAALNAAVTYKVDFAEAYIARGSAQIGLKQFSGAAADYDYALKLNGRLAAPLFGLGEAYRAMGRKNEAAQFYQRYSESRSPDAQPDLQREAEQRARDLK
jgi:tetratricopeptide (TPR) repeat protein